MSIDIHISNYEEFLYSYVDGELGEAAVAALEAFMDAHPHIRQELELLLASRLTPEPVVFDGKASLYRGSEINLHNYEPFLLNYVDGELTASEAAIVEEFAAAHPAMQKELELFRATRLQPDAAIRFEDKASLYRRSTPVRDIRPAYWWGAAAAIVTGALFFILPAEQPAPSPAVAVITAPAGSQPVAAEEQTAPAAKSRVPAETIAGVAQEPVAVPQPRAQNRQLAAVTPAAPVRQPAAVQPKAEPVATQPEPQAKAALDLASLATEAPIAKHEALIAELDKQPVYEQVEAPKRGAPSLEKRPEQALATAAPANPPGELIMSVTGNGIESKVLDKVTNVARLFSRKRNK